MRAVKPLLLCLASASLIVPGTITSSSVQSPRPRPALPVAFVENQGQWDGDARFVAAAAGFHARLERNAIALGPRPAGAPTLRLAFEAASERVGISGDDVRPGVYNYFLGADERRWRTGVRGYGAVSYHSLYPGI